MRHRDHWSFKAGSYGGMGRPLTGALIEHRSKRTGQVRSWSARVTYRGRRRKVPLHAKNARDAERKFGELMTEIRAGTWIPHDQAFETFAEDWLARQTIEGGRGRTGLSNSGRADLRWRVNHLCKFFGRMRIDEISIVDVDRYRLETVAEGNLNATSINKMISTLASIFELGVEYGRVERNPAVGRRRRLAPIRPERSWLDSAAQINALLDAAWELDKESQLRIGQRRALLATLIFAGLRLGEARALRWEDVNLALGMITVRAAKTPAGVRTVYLLPVLKRELREYLGRLDDPDEPLLFGTRGRRPLGPSNIRLRILEPARQAASVSLERQGLGSMPERLTPHSLRRTFASLLFAIGEPPTYVMSQMGHTTAGLTLSMYAREMSRRDGEQARLRALVEDHRRQVSVSTTSTNSIRTTRIISTVSHQTFGLR